MNEQLYNYFKTHLPTIQLWIDTNAQLEPSNDILKPLIEAFEKETNSKVRNCKDCIIDALVYNHIAFKKYEQQLNEQLKQSDVEHK